MKDSTCISGSTGVVSAARQHNSVSKLGTIFQRISGRDILYHALLVFKDKVGYY